MRNVKCVFYTEPDVFQLTNFDIPWNVNAIIETNCSFFKMQAKERNQMNGFGNSITCNEWDTYTVPVNIFKCKYIKFPLSWKCYLSGEITESAMKSFSV